MKFIWFFFGLTMKCVLTAVSQEDGGQREGFQQRLNELNIDVLIIDGLKMYSAPSVDNKHFTF